MCVCVRAGQYCMPAEGVPLSRREALLTRAELGAVVRALAAVGVDKLRLTGGEPTLRPDLPDIIRTYLPINVARRYYPTTPTTYKSNNDRVSLRSLYFVLLMS